MDTSAPIRPILLPVANELCQGVWDTVFDIFAREGLDEFVPVRWDLDPVHADDLAKSGIASQDAAAAAICSVGPIYLERLGIHSQEPLLCFFYLDPWGAPYTWLNAAGCRVPFCRARLNSPRNGQKYTQPPGSGIFPYFPRIAPGRIKGWSTWGLAALLDEQEQPISPYPITDALITEGEKKSLKATLEGFPTIGVGGVWNFKGAWGGVDADLGVIAERMRSLTVIYDNDCAHKPQVCAAANALLIGLAEGRFSAAQESDNADLKLKAIKEGRFQPTQAKGPPISERLFWTLLPHTLNGDKIGLDDLLINPHGATIIKSLIRYRLPGIVTLEEGTDKEGNPKKISVYPAYTAEPLGDSWLTKHLPSHGQEHLRRVLTESAMKLSYILPIQGGYPYRWDIQQRIWKQMSREEWESFPLAICDRHGWLNRKGGMIATCAAELLKHSQPREQFNPKMLVGFRNGDYDPDSDTLLPIHPSHLLLNRIDVDWVPQAGCSNFLAWLNWMWAKDSLRHQVKLLQAALRWTLEPKRGDKKFGGYANSVEAIFGLVGPAGRGKGSLLEVIWNLMGESAAKSFSLSDAANPNALAKLVGTQACIDTDQKGYLNELTIGALNKVASNEFMEIKILYKDISQARLGTVAWFAANRMPQTPSNVEDNEGWQRRFVAFICERKPETRDPAFLEKIFRELPGIIQWAWALPISEAIDTIRHFQESDPPEEHIQDLLESHSIYHWLHSILVELSEDDIKDSYTCDTVRVNLKDEQANVKDGAIWAKSSKQLHGHYLYWCEVNRERHPFKLTRFNEQLRLMGAQMILTGSKKDRTRMVRIPIETLNWDALVTGG